MEPASWVAIFIAVFVGGGMVLWFALKDLRTKKPDEQRDVNRSGSDDPERGPQA